MSLVTRGVGYGIWWASDPRRVVGTIGVVWLNTLKGPIGNFSRAMTWEALKWGGRSALGGLAFTARTTWTKLLVPVAIWSAPATVPLAAGAGVLVTAAVISGVIVAAQQEVGLVGPDAPTISDPRWFHGVEINPFTMGMGGVV